MFHDIMPGSGIGINYVDAVNNLDDARRDSGAILDGALTDIAARADTQGAGVPVVVYNPLSWERNGAIAIDLHAPPAGQRYEARDSAGQPLLSQIAAQHSATQDVSLEVMVKNVPPSATRLSTSSPSPPRARRPPLSKWPARPSRTNSFA